MQKTIFEKLKTIAYYAKYYLKLICHKFFFSSLLVLKYEQDMYNTPEI